MNEPGITIEIPGLGKALIQSDSSAAEGNA